MVRDRVLWALSFLRLAILPVPLFKIYSSTNILTFFFFLAPAGGSQWAAQRNDLIQFPVLSLEHVPILCKYSTFTLYICYMMTEVFGSRWCLA